MEALQLLATRGSSRQKKRSMKELEKLAFGSDNEDEGSDDSGEEESQQSVSESDGNTSRHVNQELEVDDDFEADD